jgi:hypothetical protein
MIDSTICFTDSIVVNGTVYNADNSMGVEIFQGVTINGCDSTVTINLNVLPAIETVTSVNEATIAAVEGYSSYQWLDCDNNNSPIEGAIGFEYTAAESGSFAVEITNENCSSISTCAEILIEEELEETPVGVFPNPTEGNISVAFDDVHEYLQVVIMSTMGTEVFNETFYDTDLIQIELNQPSGIYIVDITDENGEQYTYQFMAL